MKALLKKAGIIAHRGASKYAPENTLVSFRKAHEMGATWVEFDVMLTKDQVPIIIHDETLDRTTNGHGKVADTTWAQIQKLDAGSWFGARFKDERVPTFVELLDYLKSVGMHMNVEIKPSQGAGRATANAVLDILEQHWPMDARPPIVTSGDPFAIEVVSERAPQLLHGTVLHYPQMQQYAQHFNMVSVNEALCTPEYIQQLLDQFELVLPYTVNDAPRAKELLALGANAVFSDDPKLLDQK